MTVHQRRDDHPNPWRIQVRGHPARVKSVGWREAIRDAVTVAYPHAPFSSPPEGTKVCRRDDLPNDSRGSW
jgi:hypothetical protein